MAILLYVKVCMVLTLLRSRSKSWIYATLFSFKIYYILSTLKNTDKVCRILEKNQVKYKSQSKSKSNLSSAKRNILKLKKIYFTKRNPPKIIGG